MFFQDQAKIQKYQTAAIAFFFFILILYQYSLLFRLL